MDGEALGGDFAATRMRLPIPGPAPSAGLAGCFGYSKRITLPTRRRELPSRHVNLIFSFGDPMLLVTDNGERHRVHSFVSGLQQSAAVIERTGHQHGVHVELSPLATRALLGMPMHALSDTLIDMEDLLGKDAHHLTERLALMTHWRDRFAALDAALARRIAVGPRSTPAVAWAWNTLCATNGRVRIDDLVGQSGCSHRHLAARFRDEIGLTPKAAARVLRFEHAMRLLQQPTGSFADVAMTAGYYDQAHFNRDVRALAGCSPGALFGSPSPSDSSNTD